MSFEFQPEPRIPDKEMKQARVLTHTKRGGQGLLILRVHGELKQPLAPLVTESHGQPHPDKTGCRMGD